MESTMAWRKYESALQRHVDDHIERSRQVDYAWIGDALSLLDLQSQMYAKMGDERDDDVLDAFNTVYDVVRYVDKHIAENSGFCNVWAQRPVIMRDVLKKAVYAQYTCTRALYRFVQNDVLFAWHEKDTITILLSLARFMGDAIEHASSGDDWHFRKHAFGPDA